MHHAKAQIDTYHVQQKTHFAAEVAETQIKRALKWLDDPEKKLRLERCLCKTCFYTFSERIGGSAITMRPCGVCEVELQYPSTSTDELCLACAQLHELCKHCGADVHLRKLRRFDPENPPKKKGKKI